MTKNISFPCQDPLNSPKASAFRQLCALPVLACPFRGHRATLLLGGSECCLGHPSIRSFAEQPNANTKRTSRKGGGVLNRRTEQTVSKRGRVLLTEIPLPRIARQGTLCLISIRGQARKARIDKFELDEGCSNRIIPPSGYYNIT